jgi:hypothetical protein
MDTIEWSVKNSQRQGIVWASGADRFRRREALTLLPADERPVMKWNGNPFVIDGAAFLLPYWMGRYHKFLLGE